MASIYPLVARQYRAAIVMIQDVPAATHRGEQDLPWVQLRPQLELKVAQVDLDAGLWVIRNRFQPGASGR